MPDLAENELGIDYLDFTPDFASTPVGLTVASGFGHSPFGERDWIYETMWQTLTTGAMRAKDVAAGSYEFRRWQYAFGKVLRDRRRRARDFPLHDALETRTAHETIAVTVTAASSDTNVVTLRADGALYDDRTLAPIAPGWTFVDLAGARHALTAVRKDFASGVMADGLVYARLYEFDIAASLDEVTIGLGAFEPPSELQYLAEQYGVSLITGLQAPNQRDTVFRAEWAWRRKGSGVGIAGYAHVRGFDLEIEGLACLSAERRAQIEAIDPSYVVTGFVPWEGFVPVVGDGTFNALDSAADFSTRLGVTDSTPGLTYRQARKLGEDLGVEVEVKTPATNGLDGWLIVTYQVEVEGVRRTFRARDRRTSSTTADLIPLSAAFAALHPTLVIGVIEYQGSTYQNIALLGVDQSQVDGGITYRSFVGPVIVDFTSQRYYARRAVAPPEIARFDEIRADCIPLDTFRWMDSAAYEFSLTATVTLASTPYTTVSQHVVRVTYTWTLAVSPFPASGVPVGRWKLSDGTTDWWVESRAIVAANIDDLTVIGTLPPTTAIVKLILVPRTAASLDYATSRCIRLTTTPLGDCYTAPSSGHTVESSSVLDSVEREMVAAVAVAAVKE